MGVPLRDLLKDYRTVTGWEDLRGIAAVDAFNTLYQFLSIIRQPDGTPLVDGSGRVTSHLSGILFRNMNFIQKGIRPVYVYDGRPPEFKEGTIEERRVVRDTAREQWREALERGDIQEAAKHARASSRIDTGVIDTSKRLLRLMGIPYIEAPSEGEAQIAYMVMQGSAQYAVSQDYDTLLFGTPVLVRNMTISGKRKLHGRLITVSPEKILADRVFSGLSISRRDLIRIGILVGTDFNDGVPGIGPKLGLRAVREGRFDAIVSERMPDVDVPDILDFFEHPPVTDDYSLGWKEPDTDGIISMLCGEYAFSEERVRKVLGAEVTGTGQKTLSSWF